MKCRRPHVNLHILILLMFKNHLIFGLGTSRRSTLEHLLASALPGTSMWSAMTSPKLYEATNTEVNDLTYITDDTEKYTFDSYPSFRPYQVFPDATPTLHPTIKKLSSQSWIHSLSDKSGAIWVGEHHNSAQDHLLQEQLIRNLYNYRRKNIQNQPMAIGLEQIQVKFQPVLDSYLAGKISLQEMKKQVEWDIRWQWSFEGYSPIFETAKELQIPLIALNVNSEDLILVENGGLENLSQEQINFYIKDRQGFANFAKSEAFKEYVDYIIRPSYELHDSMGLLEYSMSGQKLKQKMPFRNFFSARILWDEAMASQAFYGWTKTQPRGSLLLGLVGSDHVKFCNGITGRYARFGAACTSVLLNPTWIDTQSSGRILSDTSQQAGDFILQLRYRKEDENPLTEGAAISTEGGVMPLSDYILLT